MCRNRPYDFRCSNLQVAVIRTRSTVMVDGLRPIRAVITTSLSRWWRGPGDRTDHHLAASPVSTPVDQSTALLEVGTNSADLFMALISGQQSSAVSPDRPSIRDGWGTGQLYRAVCRIRTSTVNGTGHFLGPSGVWPISLQRQ